MARSAAGGRPKPRPRLGRSSPLGAIGVFLAALLVLALERPLLRIGAALAAAQRVRVGGSQPLQASSGARLSRCRSAATERRATAQEVARKKKKKKADGNYRGAVNPRLRAFIQSTEYRNVVELLSRLEEQGGLQSFLDRAEKYWSEVNLFALAELERGGGGRSVLGNIRRDWPKIWPEGFEDERISAFDLFSGFWARLDRSKLVDDVMQDVLPGTDKESAEYKKFEAMDDKGRSNEIMDRVGKSDLVRQFVILNQNDAEVKRIGPKMMPFMAKFISILERKVATQTEELASSLDTGLIAGAVLLVIFVLGAFYFTSPTPQGTGVKISAF